MERSVGIGRKVLNSVCIITVSHGVKHGTRVIVIELITILIRLAGCNLTDITETCATVWLEEVDMVRVNATVNNTRYHPLTSVSLWEVNTLVNLIHTNLLTYDIHLLINATWEFHTTNALQVCNTLNVFYWSHDNGNITTYTQHPYSLCL